MDLVGANNQQMQQPRLDITKTTEVHCKSCDYDVFETKMIIRRASAILTGQPTDQFIPIDVFCCSKCGEILEELMPKL